MRRHESSKGNEQEKDIWECLLNKPFGTDIHPNYCNPTMSGHRSRDQRLRRKEQGGRGDGGEGEGGGECLENFREGIMGG